MPPDHPPVHASRAAAAASAGLLLALAGCGESPATAMPSPTASPPAAPVRACAASSIPETGFVPDPAHSGPLSVGRYSPNGDMQAALVYFHFQNGVRQVFTDLPAASAAAGPGTAPPAAGPQTPAHDQLVTCDAIEFSSSDGAQGFLGAFRQLRHDAGQPEVTAPAVGDSRAAFSDHDQDFAGYPIHGASGAEIAATRGGRFYSVSVFGPSPTLQTATAILQGMLGPAR
ncbi:MAG: hypothetical protein QOE72_1850 [Chloroflexota bacterium]|jgi:hypothetical protein|nr:hypothetical protein [Chloroflexota bacterium]